MASLYWLGVLVLVVALVRRLFLVPSGLRHLPRVPIFPLLKSYLAMEPEDMPIRNLILPFANDRQEGVVLVWVLGKWMVHILDSQIARQLSDDLALYSKARPPNDSLLWHLIGNSNILVSNSTQWKKQSRLINDAINLQMPVKQFALLGPGTNTVRWDEFAQRFAVDALGSTVFGHDFEALKQQSMFVREYNWVMAGIANPIYLIAPTLIDRIDTLIEQFVALLKAKQNSPGDDMMSYMLRDPDIASALSTLFYLLATHPDIQRRAREEIATIIDPKADFTAENLAANSLPFLNACIREALRINLSQRFQTESLKNWVPFALGPRQCPARNFAMYEQRALAAVLLREYEWELPAGSKHAKAVQNAFSPFALTLPHELNLTFRKL
ncbi:cytochrome P450 [Mycena rosella]|uniref:Cytochrome P450 n=1 Tax=Mycena rosella TaxID=1033263 RepID=A0AAD7GBW0_MYCRO|nr:cytochrome P450 [Mycena rosella]